MRVLFVSPHSDDVCLSLGALVDHVNAEKHLLTIFGRSGWAEESWEGPRDTDSISSQRAAEDSEYCDIHEFVYHNLALPDSSLRHQAQTNLRMPSGDEHRLLPLAAAGIEAIVDRCAIGAIVAPLGLEHTDHAVSSRAARFVARKRDLPCLLYEDLPYAHELSLSRIALHAWLTDRRLRPVTFRTGVSLERKLDSTKVYETQYRDAVLKGIAAHSLRLARKAGGPAAQGGQAALERLWSTEPEWSILAILEPSLQPSEVNGSGLQLTAG